MGRRSREKWKKYILHIYFFPSALAVYQKQNLDAFMQLSHVTCLQLSVIQSQVLSYSLLHRLPTRNQLAEQLSDVHAIANGA